MIHLFGTLWKRTLGGDANEVMSRGVQLPDIFDALSAEGAQRGFYQELEAIRGLCLKLLLKGRARRRLGNSVAA